MPAPVVVNGAMLTCPMGVAPSSLVVIPKGQPVMAGGQPVATIQDMVPFTNIMSFGMCNSPANPAGMGKPPPAVPTPTACTPVISGPWTPGVPQVMVGGVPVVNATCTCICALSGGAPITVSYPGQTTVLA